MQRLVKDKEEYVRWYLSSNPNAPLSILTILSKDKDPWTRANVANHSNISEDILYDMAKDPYDNVRNQVANNPKSEARTLVRVYDRERVNRDKSVLIALLTNPNSPPYLRAVVSTIVDDL
jgi:hypothetical protein